MATTTISIEEFRNDPDKLGEASAEGPVFITWSGQRTLVVLDIEEYRKLGGKKPTIVDLLGMPEGVGEIEFDPPRFVGLPNPNRDVDLSD